jgi:polyhydroxybutyrate depolymerase
MPTDRRWSRSRAAGLIAGSIDVGGLRRTYCLAPAQPSAPLLVALHGLGMSGRGLAMFSGLAARGTAAGFATVFPDGVDQRWVDGRYAGERPGVDDVGFLRALIDQLVTNRVARPGPAFLIGLSNGAFLAEKLARQALLPVAGLVLIVGTTAEHNRRATPRPLQSTAVLCICGTADPLLPYFGGQPTPGRFIGRQLHRRSHLAPDDPRRAVVAAEVLARDWAAANGDAPEPLVVSLPTIAGDPAVYQLTWSAPGRAPVVLYRVEGGGHGWPGGPQYLPARFIGPIPRHLDATALVLELAGRVTGTGSCNG